MSYTPLKDIKYIEKMREELDKENYMVAEVLWNGLKHKAEKTNEFGTRTGNPHIKFPEFVIDMGIELYARMSNEYTYMGDMFYHAFNELIDLIRFKMNMGYELDTHKINSLLK